MKEEKEICDMILSTISRFRDAQSIGIDVLDKYENINEGLVPELREIAFHVQSLARGWRSQQSRADECYEKYNQPPDLTAKVVAAELNVINLKGDTMFCTKCDKPDWTTSHDGVELSVLDTKKSYSGDPDNNPRKNVDIFHAPML